MQNEFYELCKELDYRGTMEVNIPLTTRNKMGVRFTLRRGDSFVYMEVTNEELQQLPEQHRYRIFEELRHRMRDILSKKAESKTLCSNCVYRDVSCSCNCTRDYRKRDEE